MSKSLNVMRQHTSVLPTHKRGVDSFTFTPPEGETFHSCRLTLHESRPEAGARIRSQPPKGTSGKQEIAVEWWHTGSTRLRYQLEGFANPISPAPQTPSPTRHMTAFKPSVHGFHFNNAFPPHPDITLGTPFGKLKIGNAKNGLCGGMVFTTLDFFHTQQPIADTRTPPTGDILFNYIVKRLFDSFGLPFGIKNYIELMNPNLPDGETALSKGGAAPHGRAWRTIREEWPLIKTLLDAGQPCPLGLVRIKSTDLRKLGENHQVMAYGYDVVGDDLTLYIYDPNYCDNDYVTIKLNLAHPEHPTPMIYSTGEPLLAFFAVKYRFHPPFSENTTPGRILIFEQPGFAGRQKDIHLGSPNLTLTEDGVFNDQISSFIIASGNWMFFKHSGFNSPYLRNGQPLVVGPGQYPSLNALGLPDNDISSLKTVNLPVNL